MKSVCIRIVVSSLLTLVFIPGIAQQKPCSIEVTAKATAALDGRDSGRIEFSFTDRTREYKIYWINRNPMESKNPLRGNELQNLKAGFYDFLIMDEEGCSRQITVTIKRNQN